MLAQALALRVFGQQRPGLIARWISHAAPPIRFASILGRPPRGCNATPDAGLSRPPDGASHLGAASHSAAASARAASAKRPLGNAARLAYSAVAMRSVATPQPTRRQGAAAATRQRTPMPYELLRSAGVLAVALLITLSYAAQHAPTSPEQLGGDARIYHRAGSGVARILADPGGVLSPLLRGELAEDERQALGLGEGYDSGLLRSPAYGLLLGLVYHLVGARPDHAGYAQAILLSLAVLLLYRIGRRLWGTGAGLLAALLALGYSSFLHYTTQVLTETLTLFLLVLSGLLLLLARERPALRWSQLAGIALAWLLLTKISLRFYLPLAILLWVGLLWRGGRGPALRRAGALLLGLLYVLLPWWIFTTLVFERPLLTTPLGHGPMHTIYRGNYVPEDGWENDGLGDAQGPEFVAAIARIREGDGEQRTMYVEAIRDAIAKDPAGFLRLIPKKIYRMWHRPAELWPVQVGPFRTPFQLWIHRVLLILGLLGIGWALVRKPHAAILVLPMLYLTGLHALSRVEPRFQTPLMPLVLLFCAAWLRGAGRRWRAWSGALRRPVAWALLLPALALWILGERTTPGLIARLLPDASSRMQYDVAQLPQLLAVCLGALALLRLYRRHLPAGRAACAVAIPLLALLVPWSGQRFGDITWREWACRLARDDQQVVQVIELPPNLDLAVFSRAALQIDMQAGWETDCQIAVHIDGCPVKRFAHGLRVSERKFLYPPAINPLRHRRLLEGLHEVLAEIRTAHPEREFGLEIFRQWYRIPFDLDLLRGKRRIRVAIGLRGADGTGDHVTVFGDVLAPGSAGDFYGPAFARTLYECSTEKLRFWSHDRRRADYRLWQSTELHNRGVHARFGRNDESTRHDLAPAAGRQYGQYRIRLELVCRGAYREVRRPDGDSAYRWLFDFQQRGTRGDVPLEQLRRIQRQKHLFFSGHLVF
ncbi:MAG: hypothetical protein GF330_13185 [Candidatus Eisenbacteria bacterium]|nr:hypothetical protein [Candidatus Eisenbacteria bacterium]